MSGAVAIDDSHGFNNYAVDLVRGQTYMLGSAYDAGLEGVDGNNDYVLHVYSISSGTELSQTNLTTLPVFSDYDIPFLDFWVTCIPGGNLYVLAGASGGVSPGVILFRINPDSLTVTGSAVVESEPEGGDFPNMLLGVPCHGAGGNYEYVLSINKLGVVLIPGDGSIALPRDSSTISNLGDSTSTMGCVGAQNYGETDCYLLNYTEGSSTMTVYQYKVYAGAHADPSGSSYGLYGSLIGTLSTSDFDSGMGYFIFGGILFDPTDGNLILYASNGSSSGVVMKWSPSSGVLWKVPNTIIYNASDNGVLAQALSPYCDISQGQLGYISIQGGSASANIINTSDGSYSVQNYTSLDGLSPVWQFYNSHTQSVYFQTGGSSSSDVGYMWTLFLGGKVFGPITLAQIITDICERCTLTTEQIDVSQLGWTVNGFIITRNVNGRDAIKQLTQAFPFDCVESDYKLKFIPRSQADVVNISQGDMSPGTKKGEGNYWEQTRASQQDIPTTFQVKFTDSDNYYLPNIATAKRINAPVPTVKTKQKQIIDLPMGFSLSDATVIAQTWLYTLWARSSSYAVKFGWKYLYLDPTDNIGVFFDNGDYRSVVITTINIGADYTMELEMDANNFYVYSESTPLPPNDGGYVSLGPSPSQVATASPAITAALAVVAANTPASTYAAPASTTTAGLTAGSYPHTGPSQSTAAGSSFAPFLPPTTTAGSVQAPKPSGYGRLFLFNLPLLQDKDDQGGKASTIYYAVGSYNSAGFGGGNLLMSSDGQNYNAFDSLQKTVTWGTCITALPNTNDPYSTDNVSTLTVTMASQADDPLESTSYLNLMNGANPLLVGNEIIQYENVVVNSDGSRTLFGLLRGRRGTEWACGTHVVGEAMIVLDKNVYINAIPLTSLNSAKLFKLVPTGAYPDSVAPISFTFTGADLMPYMPVNFSRAPSGSDLVVSWSRQTRLGGGLMEDIGTVPLGEETENYDAYVLSAPYNAQTANWKTPGSFVRVFSGLTSPTFTYTAAEMTADSFTPSSGTLHVVVFQNSAAIGHGWPGAADLLPA